jgi:hypothetical protein
MHSRVIDALPEGGRGVLRVKLPAASITSQSRTHFDIVIPRRPSAGSVLVHDIQGCAVVIVDISRPNQTPLTSIGC